MSVFRSAEAGCETCERIVVRLNCVAITNLGRWCNAAHRCRTRQIFWGAKDFGRDLSNLVRKNFGPLFVRTFSQAGLRVEWPPKRCSCDSANVGRHFCPDFQEFCRDFNRFYPDFARIFNITKILGVRFPPRLLHHWCSNTVTADSG